MGGLLKSDLIKHLIKHLTLPFQIFPDIRNESAALKEMPKGYLEYLRRIEPYLRNQSEDCLYLNIFAPIGKYFLLLSPLFSLGNDEMKGFAMQFLLRVLSLLTKDKKAKLGEISCVNGLQILALHSSISNWEIETELKPYFTLHYTIY